VSGARRAERASAAGARGRTNKIAGVLITAILFGSAARRCSWENRISCYQMTVRIEVLCAETLSFEYDRRSFSAGRDSLIQVCRLFAWIRGNSRKERDYFAGIASSSSSSLWDCICMYDN
jgi:hypothetical protein